MRERTDALTLTDGDGDALKLTFALNGEAVAKTVHGGRPDATRVVLSLRDQVALCTRLKENIDAQVAAANDTRPGAGVVSAVCGLCRGTGTVPARDGYGMPTGGRALCPRCRDLAAAVRRDSTSGAEGDRRGS